MIHDKDYMMRLVRQFSEFLSQMLLGGTGGDPEAQQRVFETNLKDVFKMKDDELSAMSAAEIAEWVSTKEIQHHNAYFEQLGNYFFYKFKENPGKDYAAKAQMFYEKWLTGSQIFSLPVMARITELKTYQNA